VTCGDTLCFAIPPHILTRGKEISQSQNLILKEKVGNCECLTVVMKRDVMKLRKENGRPWPQEM